MMEINISSLAGVGADMNAKHTPENSSWLWTLVGVMLAMFALSWLGAWIAEALV